MNVSRYFRRYYHRIAVLLIILTHAYLRLVNPLHIQFDYDQEMISQKAWNIVVSKDVTLLGTRVGEYPFFTPPYYIYLTSLFLGIFNLHPVANFYHSYFWSLVGLWIVYLFVKNMFGARTALFAIMIKAVSPFLVFYDRIPWNPDPIFFLSTLTYWLLWRLLTHGLLTKNEVLLLAITVGFASSTHFTGMILVLISVVFLFWYRQYKQVLVLMAVISAIWSPILVFDLRHDWLNFKGILSLVKDEATSSYANDFLYILKNESSIIIANTGRLILGDMFHKTIQVIIGALIIVGFLVQKKHSKEKSLFVVAAVTVIGTLALYRGDKPEYYYMILLPLSICAIAYLYNKLFVKKPRYVILLALLSISVIKSLEISQSKPSQHLGNKIDVIQYISKQAQQQPLRLEYDMLWQWRFGYNYLADYFHINKDPNSSTAYWLVYPTLPEKKYDFVSGELGVIKQVSEQNN